MVGSGKYNSECMWRFNMVEIFVDSCEENLLFCPAGIIFQINFFGGRKVYKSGI